MKNSFEIIKMLKEVGFRLVRVKGSHHHFGHPDRPSVVTVPHPKKAMPLGTIKSVFKSAGIK